MKILSALILFATACGSDYTTLEVTCGTPEVFSNNYSPTVLGSAETTALWPLARPVQADEENSQNRTSEGTVKPNPLVLSPSSELLGPVRAAAERFTQRLKIPVVVAEGGISVTVQDTVTRQGVPVSGLASYRGSVCKYSECNGKAFIVIERPLLTHKLSLAEVLDHEIGHILSGWGSAAGTNMHILENDHVMSATIYHGVQWTQRDINLWCSGSPCGRTELEAEWTYPVLPPQVAISDGGTSLLSDSGLRADGGSGLTDAGLD